MKDETSAARQLIAHCLCLNPHPSAFILSLRRNPLGQRHERRFQVQLVFLEQRQLVAGLDQQRGQVAVVGRARRRSVTISTSPRGSTFSTLG